MPDKSEPQISRMLKAPAAMAASIAVHRGVEAGWKLVTHTDPPAAGDRQVPLGRAVAWAALVGGAIPTARMIASRYASTVLVPRSQRQGSPQPGPADGQALPQPQPEAPGLPYLITVAALAWRRRR